jgi:hypothetical protein
MMMGALSLLEDEEEEEEDYPEDVKKEDIRYFTL